MSKVIDTIRQIKTGLWGIEPMHALGLQTTVEQILAKGENPTLKKEDLEARHYILDVDGNKYQSSKQNEVPEGSIGFVHITGSMIKYGNYYCWGADELVAQAEAFDNNPNIIGQIWRLDTGGGAINAVAPYRNFLFNKKKPVVNLFDTCGSAGVWATTLCDYIMAENSISASFGSIGIMASLRNMKDYWKNLGIEDHTIYADQSTHKNKAWELALEGKYELIKQEHLNPLAIKFQEDVKASRKNLNLNIEGILNGKMFYAEKALAHGLIDGIGNLQKAIEKVTELSQVQKFMNNY